jgi:hypothetical protein
MMIACLFTINGLQSNINCSIINNSIESVEHGTFKFDGFNKKSCGYIDPYFFVQGTIADDISISELSNEYRKFTGDKNAFVKIVPEHEFISYSKLKSMLMLDN